MSTWANFGLSALSNVTQSVQALSSYAQVVLHEAREEVEAELIGNADNASASPSPDAAVEADSSRYISEAPSAFSSRAHFTSPPKFSNRATSLSEESNLAPDAVESPLSETYSSSELRDKVLQLQTYVSALEQQLARNQPAAASQDASDSLQEECMRLQQRLLMQQQQLEDLSLENKLLVQAVSVKNAVADGAAVGQEREISLSSRAHNKLQLQEQAQAQQLQVQVDDAAVTLRLQSESYFESSIDAAAAAAAAAATTATSHIQFQTELISKLESDISSLKLQLLAAESREGLAVSMQAALAEKDSEIQQLRKLVHDADEAASVSNASLCKLQQQHDLLLQQRQKDASSNACTNSECKNLGDGVHCSEATASERLYVELPSQDSAGVAAAKSMLQSEADEIEKRFRLELSAYDSSISHQQEQLQLAFSKLSQLHTHLNQQRHEIREEETSSLQLRVKQLECENASLKESAASLSVALQKAQDAKDCIETQLKTLTIDFERVQDVGNQQNASLAREVTSLTNRCSALSDEIFKLQSDNASLKTSSKLQHESASDSKDIAASQRQLEAYIQSESKLLLELNRRLGLAKRCVHLAHASVASLSSCIDSDVKASAAVEEQQFDAASPAAALTALGKNLDHLVLKLMDVKKLSEHAAVSVPASKHDCDRLMSKVIELEKSRAEWMETQGELALAKSSIMKYVQQQQARDQVEASVLSVLQSCGGVSPAESLSHAAARVAQELKTARTTVSELARQVEVERSSSSSRNRAADSQGSEYRAALAAAEQKHAAEVAVMKSQLRKSELQCEQLSFDIQSTTKANSELKDQVDAFESVLAEKEAELSDISQQLRLARALVSSLSEQAEASMNLELIRLRKKASGLESQLQEAAAANSLLDAENQRLQFLPSRVRELEVLCSKKDREISLMQISVAQSQEELSMLASRSRCESFMVDRRLVSNLIVQYVAGNSSRKTEVLRLIAQVLEFDAEAQQRVGLCGKGWMSWIAASSDKSVDSTQNIGDLWVKFLLDSAKSDGDSFLINKP